MFDTMQFMSVFLRFVSTWYLAQSYLFIIHKGEIDREVPHQYNSQYNVHDAQYGMHP